MGPQITISGGEFGDLVQPAVGGDPLGSNFCIAYQRIYSSSDDEELTRTRKVRRSFVEQRYERIIAALYGEEKHIAIDTTIKFQDGKTARIQADLAVRSL